jgi:hypothetical protein
MEKNKTITIVVVVVAVIALGIGLWVWSSKSNGNKTNETPKSSGGELTLFYSTSCPHCKKVEQFIAENKVEEKIKISQLEVSGSQNNAQKFFEAAKVCGISQENAGVPMLLNEGKCLQGDADIINFFKERM